MSRSTILMVLLAIAAVSARPFSSGNEALLLDYPSLNARTLAELDSLDTSLFGRDETDGTNQNGGYADSESSMQKLPDANMDPRLLSKLSSSSRTSGRTERLNRLQRQRQIAHDAQNNAAPQAAPQTAPQAAPNAGSIKLGHGGSRARGRAPSHYVITPPLRVHRHDEHPADSEEHAQPAQSRVNRMTTSPISNLLPHGLGNNRQSTFSGFSHPQTVFPNNAQQGRPEL